MNRRYTIYERDIIENKWIESAVLGDKYLLKALIEKLFSVSTYGEDWLVVFDYNGKCIQDHKHLSKNDIIELTGINN